ncbi:MAG: protein of unknown function with transrane region [Parcubacteria group bacterium]|nr:protein of unknown function with transrane region [Parcubacteria group bacterium]
MNNTPLIVALVALVLGTSYVVLRPVAPIETQPTIVIPVATSTPSKPLPPKPAPEKGVVNGQVLLGPTCPNERNPPEAKCAPRPYQTTIVVQSVESSRITSVTSDVAGYFSVSLAPGMYTLAPSGGSVFPRCSETKVVVVGGKTETMNLHCDSGIR